MNTVLKQMYEMEGLRPTSQEYIALNEKINRMQYNLERSINHDDMAKVYEYLEAIHQLVDMEKQELVEQIFSMAMNVTIEALSKCGKDVQADN